MSHRFGSQFYASLGAKMNSKVMVTAGLGLPLV